VLDPKHTQEKKKKHNKKRKTPLSEQTQKNRENKS
jgi:hypothetical protein